MSLAKIEASNIQARLQDGISEQQKIKLINKNAPLINRSQILAQDWLISFLATQKLHSAKPHQNTQDNHRYKVKILVRLIKLIRKKIVNQKQTVLVTSISLRKSAGSSTQ